MAAQEVIHFLFWAQLSRCSNSPALSPPEPVAEPPPQPEDRANLCPLRLNSDPLRDSCTQPAPRTFFRSGH
jgi:hypothetical protein